MSIKEFILIFVLFYAIKITIPYRIKSIYFNGKAFFIKIVKYRTLITEEMYNNLTDEERSICKIGDVYWEESNNIIILKIGL